MDQSSLDNDIKSHEPEPVSPMWYVLWVCLIGFGVSVACYVQGIAPEAFSVSSTLFAFGSIISGFMLEVEKRL